MIFVHIDQLRPGMIVGQSLTVDTAQVPLIIVNQKLTIRNIRKLRELNVPGVYIKTKYSEDVVATPFIDPVVRQKITNDLKKICNNFIAKAAITSEMANKLVDLSGELMNRVLEKDSYLINMVEIKTFDNYTYSHSVNVAMLSTLIGLQLGYSKVSLKELTIAGLMHDFGKLEIPIAIINKPAELTEEEFAMIQQHPTLAVNRLKHTVQISMTALDGIASHHEKFNGTGYPYGLEGSDIPLCGRILAIADVYDALTTARSYRPAWQVRDALEFMRRQSNIHFDPYILNEFFKTIALYPVGSMVKLSDGSTALVIKNYAGKIDSPVVRILVSTTLALGSEIDLSETHMLKISSSLDANNEIPYEIF